MLDRSQGLQTVQQLGISSATEIALFLDVDGTLLEIAPTPLAVVVPNSLKDLLRRAAMQEAGAVALVSGRSLRDLDTLFAPQVFTAAGQHGLERRAADGQMWRLQVDVAQLDAARATLVQFVAQHPSLLLEDKGRALALHYRSAPELAELVHGKMQAVLGALQGFQLRPGKCVVELVPSGASKRTAIEAFMTEAPFAGRVPVFIGDDLSDEDGFAAVNALDGHSVRVGKTAFTTARAHMDDVASVIDWLSQRYLTHLSHNSDRISQ